MIVKFGVRKGADISHSWHEDIGHQTDRQEKCIWKMEQEMFCFLANTEDQTQRWTEYQYNKAAELLTDGISKQLLDIFMDMKQILHALSFYNIYINLYFHYSLIFCVYAVTLVRC